MKKAIIILSAAMLLFTACSPADTNVPPNESFEQVSSKTVEEPAKGMSTEELDMDLYLNGITVRVPDDEEGAEVRVAASYSQNGEMGRYNSFFGNCTYIYARILNSEKYSDEPFPIVILQGFNKKDLENGGFVLINEKKYSKDELAGFIFYEDETTVIYDIREPLCEVSLNSYLYELGGNTHEYQWLNEVYYILYERNYGGRLFNYAPDTDMTLASNGRMCDVSDEESLEKIRVYLNGLNAFKYFDKYPPSGKGYDLSEQTVIRALYCAETVTEEEIAEWKAQNLPKEDVSLYGSFIKKSDFESYLNDSFCGDKENIDLSGLSSYYVPSVKCYAVPIRDNYTGQVRILKSFEEKENQIKLRYSFLYCDGPTTDTERPLTAMGSDDIVGVINSKEIMLNSAKFEAVQTYEFVFCKEGEKLKLHSIYQK